MVLTTTWYLQTSGPSNEFQVLFGIHVCVSESEDGHREKKKENEQENNISNRITTTYCHPAALHSHYCQALHQCVWAKAQSLHPHSLHIKATAAMLLSNFSPQFSVTKFYLLQISGSL